MKINKNLKYLVKQNELTLRTLERNCDIGVSNLSRITRGVYREENLPLVTILKFAEHFQISLDEFVNKDLENSEFDTTHIKINQTYVRSNMLYFLEIWKLNLNQLSKEIGVLRITLVRIRDELTNEKNITIQTVSKLSNYFKLTLDDFVFKDFSKK